MDMTPSDSRTNFPLILKFEERNRLKFNSSTICELCGALAEAMACPTKKYTANILEKKARISHFGMHTCKTNFVNNRPTDLVAAAISVVLKLNLRKFRETLSLQQYKNVSHGME